MLSPSTLARTVLSLVLIAIFSVGSNELRISFSTILSWALGLVAHHRLSLSPTFLRCHGAFIVVTFCLLAAYNDLFYENTAGRLLDLFFTRAWYDDETPGSGFTDWHESIAYRHRDDIAFAWRFLRFAIRSTLVAISLPFVVVFVHVCLVVDKQTGALTRALEAVDESRLAQPSWALPERKTRKTRLDDNYYFDWPGCKFERKVTGDYDDTIARRRQLSKRFA